MVGRTDLLRHPLQPGNHLQEDCQRDLRHQLLEQPFPRQAERTDLCRRRLVPERLQRHRKDQLHRQLRHCRLAHREQNQLRQVHRMDRLLRLELEYPLVGCRTDLVPLELALRVLQTDHCPPVRLVPREQEFQRDRLPQARLANRQVALCRKGQLHCPQVRGLQVRGPQVRGLQVL